MMTLMTKWMTDAQLDMLTRCQKPAGVYLSQWERSFIVSLGQNRGWDLSEKQVGHLEKIFKRVQAPRQKAVHPL